MHTRAAITTILLAYLALASTYSLITPLGEGPDEPGHAKYVFFLAREWRLPVQCAAPCQSEVPGEGHQPPLAYLLMTPALFWMPREQRSFDLPGNRNFIWAAGTHVNAVGHGSREYWPWQGEVLAWHLARLVNVALGAGVVCFTYLIGRQMFGAIVGLTSSALVAFNPQFLFTSGLITNDVLLTLLCAVLLHLITAAHSIVPDAKQLSQAETGKPHTLRGFAASREHKQPSNVAIGYRSLAIGTVLGLALITKQSAILLVPIVGLWCLLQPQTQRFSGSAVQRFSGSLLIVFIPAILISGCWYLRNTQLYGDPFGLAIFRTEFITQAFEAGKPDAWWSALITLHESFWVRFGWMNVRPPDWVIWVYGTIELLALIGISRQLLARKRNNRFVDNSQLPMTNDQLWPLIALPLLTFAWLLSFAFTAGLVAWQGRLLFPALPAIAIGLAYGLVGLRVRQAAFLWLPLFTILASIAAWLPFGVIKPTYPFYTLPAEVGEARITNPIYARFAARRDERGAVVRNLAVEGRPAAGETIQVKLLWNALGRQGRDWWVFMHLVDQQETIVSEDNRQPTDGNFPMLQWVAGDWIESIHPLVLPANLVPGTYRLRIGLWNPLNNRRAGYYDQETTLLGDYFEIPIQIER